MRLRALLPFALLPILLACNTGPEKPVEPHTPGPINAAIGDESFIETFNRAPEADDGDDLRITTHLRYVETLLRARNVAHLPAAEQLARARMLDRLNAYWRAGVFPRNVEGTARSPRFVEPADDSSERRVCAVGAIAEPDLGSEAIDAIAKRYEHDFIATIHDPAFEKWAAASGLTLDDLAMIQPSYDFMERPRPATDLTEPEIAARMGAERSRVNQCVYDVLSARQAHPTQITASFNIGADGVTREVTINGTTQPTIRTCVERAISGVQFRRTPKGKRSAHSFTIIGPRTSEGTLETAYLPTFFRRADAEVNRCGSALTVPNRSSLGVSVRTELDPQGILRVRSVLAEVDGNPVPRSITTCIAHAVESLAGPTFKGEATEHAHFYTMQLARPLAEF